MGIVSVFYAAFGYLTLLAAILWGMLFVGEGVNGSLMDAPATVPPLAAILIDLGLLLLLALLHRLAARGMLRHITEWSIPHGLVRPSQAWAATLALVMLYAAWQPLSRRIWNFTRPLEWAILALFYLAWTLVLIGAFLPGQITRGTSSPDHVSCAALSAAVRRHPPCDVGHVDDVRRTSAAGDNGYGILAVRQCLGGTQHPRARNPPRVFIPG